MTFAGQLDLAGIPALTEAELRETWVADGLVRIEAMGYGVEFGADDLRERFPDFAASCPSHQLWGTLFRRANHEGLVSFVGFKESANPTRRGGVQRTWVRT